MAVLSLESQVRIPDGILFKDLAGETVLLNLNTGVYFGLDPVGTRIWQLLQDGQSLHQVLIRLREEFDADPARGEADLIRLITSLLEHGLLEPVASPHP
ncbi:MAG: PqqD family protein [Candidatus Omnitrophica bacterium]|nr:PqqD family protein [Candidatus Omnitrophota bacterium]